MRFFIDNINLMLFLPVFVCFIAAANGLTANRFDKKLVSSLSLFVSAICLVFAAAGFVDSGGNPVSIESNLLWLSSESANFYLGTLVDRTSVIFLLLSAAAALLIQIFAYMKMCTSENYNRLVFYLNLFAFGLFGVFLAPNILQAYIMCEVTGAASYLLINFDFSNRNESRAAIKSFIFNRIGDLTLLFCVLTILYFSVTYNQLFDARSLAFTNMDSIAANVNSLMSDPIYTAFCSILIFVIIMKFMQAFIYITFEQTERTPLSRVIFTQNALISLIGIYLFLRFDVFFFNLSHNWVWAVFIIAFIFVLTGFANRVFVPMCKAAAWFEKYVVDSVIGFVELFMRGASFLCCRFQAGTFQTYLIYSLIGLITIFVFVLGFYLLMVKI